MQKKKTAELNLETPSLCLVPVVSSGILCSPLCWWRTTTFGKQASLPSFLSIYGAQFQQFLDHRPFNLGHKIPWTYAVSQTSYNNKQLRRMTGFWWGMDELVGFRLNSVNKLFIHIRIQSEIPSYHQTNYFKYL